MAFRRQVMHISAGRGSAAEPLIAGKHNVNVRGSRNRTPLLMCVWDDYAEVVKMLIDAGVDVDHVNDFGWPGLLEVIELGGDDLDHLKITKALIDAGADVYLTDNKGNTPLYLAKKHNLRRVAKLIEDTGGHE
ncbi:hypothetical protein LSM04_001464 [Trypanosoma melophagium]|uniref:uncharacterized protein n=1 Tax=Trypanosoma melophagium TaxID=715481 RepID=UPI00351A8154|nr:hypothetical protein LSM04_001464 [Trypanosoma melophagium]